jgi:hypothetical protein
MMVYNNQYYCVSWLCPMSGILNTTKHNVSESESVSVLRWGGGGIPIQLGPLERAYLNH